MSNPQIRHIEESWKEKTNSANQLFNQSKFKEALTGYEAALFNAMILNDHKPEATRLGIPFMQIFAISCNNMAFTYEEMGEVGLGKKMLERVVHYFLFLSQENQTNGVILQNELKRAFLTYRDFSVRQGLELQDQQKVFDTIQEHISSSLNDSSP